MSSQPIFTLTALPTTVVLVTTMLATIAFTYTACVLEKNCPALPHLDRYYAAMVGMPAYAEHVHTAERKHQALDESDEVRGLPQP